MTGERGSLSHHPAPYRDRVELWEAWFGIAAGPLAWFVQLTANYGLSSLSCIGGAPAQGHGWALPSTAFISLFCLLLAAASIWLSVLVLRRTRDEVEGDHEDLLEKGGGRTRFLALWGLVLGIGFGAAVLINALLLLAMPSCGS